MKIIKLNSMVKGWFVGNFFPTVFKTKDVEVGVKYYKKGDNEPSHHHKISTEITVIIYGRAIMNNRTLDPGDIVLINPNESTNFIVEKDTCTVVVKLPSSLNDKFYD